LKDLNLPREHTISLFFYIHFIKKGYHVTENMPLYRPFFDHSPWNSSAANIRWWWRTIATCDLDGECLENLKS
jgi:hypothetical protein